MVKAANVRLDDEPEYEEEFSDATEIHHGVLMLNGEINQENCSSVIANILASNITRQEDTITLVINSGGGSLSAAFALISIMRASSIPVTTVAIGECLSAALMIFMSGALRLTDKNTSFLSHQFSASFPGHTKAVDLKSRQRDLQLTEKKIEDLYIECTGLERKVIIKNLLTSSDVFLTADEVISFGLADDLFTSLDQIIPQTAEEETL